MDSRDRELYELSSQIAEKLSGLPDDGKPKTITVTQSGDGTIVLGSQVIINPPSKNDARREIPIQEQSNSWLLSAIRENKHHISAARRRKWLSLPTISFVFVVLVLILYALTFLLGLMHSQSSEFIVPFFEMLTGNPIFLAVFSAILALLGFWMDRNRKIEDRIIAESSETIQLLTSILRRRQG
ncbi:hypothetical protein ACI2JR_17635 [Klebsiella sp. NPDC088457]